MSPLGRSEQKKGALCVLSVLERETWLKSESFISCVHACVRACMRACVVHSLRACLCVYVRAHARARV